MKKKYLIYTIILLAVPFLLDLLARFQPVRFILISRFRTSFDKDTWFTFWGSYLPGISFGLISLYNTELVKNQQKRIEEFEEKYRFRIDYAELYQYDKDSKKFWEYTTEELIKKFESVPESSGANYEDGYLLRFKIEDVVEWAAVDKVTSTALLWRIADNNYGSLCMKALHGWRDDNSEDVLVYWLFNQDKDLNTAVSSHLDNYEFDHEKYKLSTINLKLEVKLDDDREYKLALKFEIKSDSTCGHPVIRSRRCYVEQG